MFGKPKVPAKAVILADEGCGMTENTSEFSLQLQKYIVEVRPDGAPAFRTEARVWVSWIEMPSVGDEVNALYEPGTTKAEIVIQGDPRFDWVLRAAQKKAQMQATREALLNQPPAQTTTQTSRPGAAPPVIHEQDLLELERRHREGQLTDDQFTAAVAKLFGG